MIPSDTGRDGRVSDWMRWKIRLHPVRLEMDAGVAVEFGYAPPPVTLELQHRSSRCHKSCVSQAAFRRSRGHSLTSPFHLAKVPSRRREGPWSRSCVAAWQPTQMSPHQND